MGGVEVWFHQITVFYMLRYHSLSAIEGAMCLYWTGGWMDPRIFLHTVLLREADRSPPSSDEAKNGGGKPPLLHMYS
jgi:hypothetical protein